MGFSLSAKDEKKLVGVDPRLVSFVRRMALVSPVVFTVTEGVRTKKRQKELYAQKLTKTLNSKHLTGDAVDIAPVIKGKVSYDWTHYHALIKRAKAEAVTMKIAMIFGYDWGWDAPHWELKEIDD